MFASVGYHEASIVKITEEAGVGLGTFYLYFEGKQAIFDEVVEDLNRRVRHAMTRRRPLAGTRLEAERAGFRAFFRFTAEHPALYRIIRQAEFVSPGRPAAALHPDRQRLHRGAQSRAAQRRGPATWTPPSRPGP